MGLSGDGSNRLHDVVIYFELSFPSFLLLIGEEPSLLVSSMWEGGGSMWVDTCGFNACN